MILLHSILVHNISKFSESSFKKTIHTCCPAHCQWAEYKSYTPSTSRTKHMRLWRAQVTEQTTLQGRAPQYIHLSELLNWF